MKTNPKFKKLSITFDKVEEEAAAIDKAQDGTRRTRVENTLVVGKLLWKAHDKLANYGDGVFNRWCKERLKLKRTTAWKIMTVHDYFGEDCSQCKQSYALSALYLLSRPSTPGRFRKMAKAFAAKGGKVDHWRVKLWMDLDQDESKPANPREEDEDPEPTPDEERPSPPEPALNILKEAWARATDDERRLFDAWRKKREQREKENERLRPGWLKKFQAKQQRKAKADERKAG